MKEETTNTIATESKVRKLTNTTVIRFIDQGREYTFSDQDFQRVETYCENECMGIQFLINANLLRQLVAYANELGIRPPYSISDLSSPAIQRKLEENHEMENMLNNFGTTDLFRVVRIAAKQTYSFIRKN